MDEHLKKVREDIDNMNKVFDPPEGTGGTEAPGTESASTKAPSTEVAATEAPATEAPATEVPKTKAPGTEAPGTKAPTTEAPMEDEGERLRKENESLRDRLNELTKLKEQPKTSAPVTDLPIETVEFLKDLDMDELTRSPEELNKLLNVVYSKGLGASEKVVVEKVLRSLPDIVKTSLTTISSLKQARDKFYEDNKDLLPFEGDVAAAFEEVASENPGKGFDELSKDVAERAKEKVKKKVELYGKATGKEGGKDRHPTLPHRKGQQRQTTQKPNLTPIEDEIDKMNESLDS